MFFLRLYFGAIFLGIILHLVFCIEGHHDTTSVNVVSVNAGAVLKGTNVSGIYGCHSGNNSVNFKHLCYREVISRGSSFMDIMAITFCEENAIPVVIFDLQEPGNISRAACGDQVGTLIDRVGRMV